MNIKLKYMVRKKKILLSLIRNVKRIKRLPALIKDVVTMKSSKTIICKFDAVYILAVINILALFIYFVGVVRESSCTWFTGC